jgi:hypothetical protein
MVPSIDAIAERGFAGAAFSPVALGGLAFPGLEDALPDARMSRRADANVRAGI